MIVVRDCFDFPLLRSVIGPGNSRRPLNQSDAKLTLWSPAFSRAFPVTPSLHRLILVLRSSIETPRDEHQNLPITTKDTMSQYQPSTCTQIKDLSI